jgi:hypothetical protein
MRVAIAQMLLAVLLSTSSQAQTSNIFSMVSPKLKQFLTAHPEASLAMSNVLSEAFPNRTVQLFYFYSDDESTARASHYYQDESSVGIIIRENQQPCDECMCLIYEMLNSEGEKRFLELTEQAKSGAVSKEGFVMGIKQQEFQADMKMQNLVRKFRFSEKEKAESYFYNRVIHEPSNFEESLSYAKKVSPKRDQIKDYEQEYDYLQKSSVAV